jgi:hypothetical protein
VLCISQTAKAFDLTRDTVGCAVYIMDHYLSKKSVNKILLQLVSMVSMYIASKMHEHQPISMVSCWTRINVKTTCHNHCLTLSPPPMVLGGDGAPVATQVHAS